MRFFFFFQAEDGIRDKLVTGVQTCALPISDTTATLRASEIGAEVVLKATKVDGIYTSDPKKDPKATRYEKLTYMEALKNRLQVMDSTAFSMCMDNKIPIIVFDLFQPGNIKRVILGEP